MRINYDYMMKFCTEAHVFTSRHQDECKAWAELRVFEESLLEHIGKLKAFCSIETSVNETGDGGNYIFKGRNGSPILTAIVYRDGSNYSYIQIILNFEQLGKLKALKEVESD